MDEYRHEQRRLAHRGLRFHFISYDAQLADEKRKQPAMPATWYLESSGNRWPAIPQVVPQPEAELETQLLLWLEDHVFAPSPALVTAPVPAPPPASQWIGALPNRGPDA
jgi:hypothetical protein